MVSRFNQKSVNKTDIWDVVPGVVPVVGAITILKDKTGAVVRVSSNLRVRPIGKKRSFNVPMTLDNKGKL